MKFTFTELKEGEKRLTGELQYDSYRYQLLTLAVHVDHEREDNPEELIGIEHEYLISKIVSKAGNGIPDTIFLARPRERDVPLDYFGFYNKPEGGLISIAKTDEAHEEQTGGYSKLFLSPGRFQKWLGLLDMPPSSWNPGFMYGERIKGRRNYRASGISRLSDLIS